MIAKGRGAVLVGVMAAAVIGWSRSSGAALITWHLSGTISYVTPGVELGVSVGSLWSGSITFDPNTPPQYVDPGSTVFVDDYGGATHKIDVTSGSFAAVGYEDPTAPAHAAGVSTVQLDPNGPALWNELVFGNDVENYSGLEDLGFGLARFVFAMNTPTDYFSFDHLPTSPPDLTLGSGTFEVQSTAANLSFYIDGVVSSVVPEPTAGGLLALSAALLAMRCGLSIAARPRRATVGDGLGRTATRL